MVIYVKTQEEKEKIENRLISEHCPSMFDLKDCEDNCHVVMEDEDVKYIYCTECWKQSGFEVKLLSDVIFPFQ